MLKPDNVPMAYLMLAILLIASSVTAQPQWRILPNGPPGPGRHDDIFFINADTGWVVNGSGLVYKTVDGGDTWDNTFGTSTYFRCVGFSSPMKGWAGTLSDLFYATSDGGETWAPVAGIPEPRPQSICGISVVDDSVVYAVGAYFGVPRMIKTTDAGNS